MKIIYNSEYGGFSWPEEIVEKFGLRGWNDASRANRTNPEIVSRIEQIIQPYIERKQQFINQWDNWCKNNVPTGLRIAVIPDDVTDWMISDYDGIETIYFVRNGRLYYDTDDGLGALVNEVE